MIPADIISPNISKENEMRSVGNGAVAGIANMQMMPPIKKNNETNFFINLILLNILYHNYISMSIYNENSLIIQSSFRTYRQMCSV